MLRLWEVLSVYSQISYDQLMKLEIDSVLIKLPRFEEVFALSDQELVKRLPFLHDPREITRLAALYMLYIEETKDEFTEYLNLHPLELAVTILRSMPWNNTRKMRSYFVQRMPTENVIDYIRELRSLELTDITMSDVFIEAMQRNTKNYNEELVRELVELIEEYEEMGEHVDWTRAIVPYASDSLLERLVEQFDEDEMLEFIYEAALENGEARLSHIVDYMNTYRDYESQLQGYLDVVEFLENVPSNYGTIVMTLAKKLGKKLMELDLQLTTFNAWKMKVLNGQV